MIVFRKRLLKLIEVLLAFMHSINVFFFFLSQQWWFLELYCKLVQESCAIAKIAARCTDKSKQTATYPPNIM